MQHECYITILCFFSFSFFFYNSEIYFTTGHNFSTFFKDKYNNYFLMANHTNRTVSVYVMF